MNRLQELLEVLMWEAFRLAISTHGENNVKKAIDKAIKIGK